MQLSCAIITLQILWAKPGNPREGGRVERSNEWGGRSREGEARAKPGNQLVTNTMKPAYFSFRHTTPTEVEQIMQSLDTKKATGPDRIPAKLIKPAAGPLSHQLTKVFNQCVDNNEFPSNAKLADVVPVHKKNDNLNIMNYRPVSILL